jgi:membrane fusion protein (multidrug efflux system)
VLPSQEEHARVFTGVVRLGADDDPERRLQPGMFVRASVELRAARGALTVPVDSLIEGPDGFHVFVVLPGEPPTAGIVPVRVLARDERRAAVEVAGDVPLAIGDAVVLVGKENLAPGMPLVLTTPPSGAAAGPEGHAPAASQ